MNRLPWTGVSLLVLLAFFGRSLARSSACSWFPTSEFRDISLACSGSVVTAPPRLTPPTLQSLYLTGTGLRVLSGEVFSGRQLSRLRYLSITDGVLFSVGKNALCSLSDLAVLDLSSNKLHQMDTSSFECNRKLLRVDLSGNTDLDRLPALFSDSIETLDADRCNIADVVVADLDGLPALKILHLNGNPHLDCQAVKSRLSAARPSLQVLCDGSGGSDSPRVSGVNNISNTQSKSSIEEQTDRTATKRFLHTTTEIHTQQTAGSTGWTSYAINKTTFTILVSMVVLLSVIIFSLLICYLKPKASC